MDIQSQDASISITELDPSKKYIVTYDPRWVSKSEIHRTLISLHGEGIVCFALGSMDQKISFRNIWQFVKWYFRVR